MQILFMFHVAEGTLWHESGAGPHVKADPTQPCDHVDCTLAHATAVTLHHCSNIQMSSLKIYTIYTD